VKPQTAAFLEKSRELLDRTAKMLGVGLNEDAGRTAYLAGLHAAQAFLFETTGRVFKKHSTVQSEFGRLTRDDPRFDIELRAFLGRAYNLKAIADYETGPGSRVSAESASAALGTARRFVDSVASRLPANGHTPRAPDEPPEP
jgi:uncharacterized protein (UPF0332 family)